MEARSNWIILLTMILIEGIELLPANVSDDCIHHLLDEDFDNDLVLCQQCLLPFLQEDNNNIIDTEEACMLQEMCFEVLSNIEEDDSGRLKRSLTIRENDCELPPLKFVQNIMDHYGLNHLSLVIPESGLSASNKILRKLHEIMQSQNFVNVLKSSNIFLRSQRALKTLFMFVCHQKLDLISTFEQLSVSKTFNGKENVWFAYNTNECELKNEPGQISIFDKLNLTIKSQLYWANACSKDLTTTYEVYQTAPHLHVIYKQYGFWGPKGGLNTVINSIWERRMDLAGVEIATVSKPDIPYIDYKKIPGNSKYYRIDGYMAEVWNELQQVLGFNYTVVESIDGKYGSQTSNGSYDGMTGMVHRREVDVGISTFFMGSNRVNAVDFSRIVILAQVRIAIKRPNSNVGGWMTYLSPFSWPTWVLVTIMVFTATFALQAAYSNKTTKPTEPQILTCFRTICQQGSPDDPTPISVRIAFITIFLASLVVFASYGAILTSFLAVSKPKLPFHNLEEMFHSTDYQLTTRGGGSIEHFISKATQGVEKQILDAGRFHAFNTHKEGIDKVLSSSSTAFYFQVETIIEQSKASCDLVFVGEPVMTGKNVMIMNKDFPYTDLINYWLEKMEESGQLDKLWAKWKPTQPKDCVLLTDANSIGFDKLKSAFLLLGLAVPISLCILCFENFHKCCSSPRNFN